MNRKIVPDIVRDQKIELLSPATTVGEAARNMTERHIGAVLVGTDGTLQGIFTERDALTRVLSQSRDPDATALSDVMTADPVTLGPDDAAIDALELMRDKGFRHLPVVDADRVVGIVSIRDLYAAVKKDLETDLKQREVFIFDTGYGSG